MSDDTIRIETPADTLDEFLRLPVGLESDDPRFVVRRLPPKEFERVYDCVDVAFGKRRARDHYDWMYRNNPFGQARVWAVEEVASGKLLKCGANFPWPIWCGDQAIVGSLAGDAATIPEWQRKGLSRIRREVRRSHPWHGKICSIAGPNAGSRVVTRKAGEAATMLGELTGGVAVLRGAALLERARVPGLVAGAAGRVLDGAAGLVRRGTLRAGDATAHFLPVDRFDTDFDPVTLRTMRFPLYWSPHNADFLNWRYLDHPAEDYRAFALVEDDRPIAYSVLRIGDPEATLAEFAAPADRPDCARRLLGATLEVAREAGCGWVNFFGTPVWRHWSLFRKAGFLPYRTNNHLDAGYKADEPRVQNLRHWQVTPGDRDYH